MNASKLLLLSALTTFQLVGLSQSTSQTSINSPLRMISIMSTTARYSYGMATSKLSTTNNWNTQLGTNHAAALGWTYSIKNFITFDAQFTFEKNSFTYKNQGVVVNTGHSNFGGEVGIKKQFPTKPDDTFFVRGAFGYNFLIKSAEGVTNEFFSYSGSPSGSAMYVMPEIGYQLRLGIKNMIDFSAFYHYGLNTVATTDLLYKDSNNPLNNERSTATANGRYFGAAIKYHFIFWGTKKSMEIRKAPQEKF